MRQNGMIFCTTREAAEMLGVSLRTVQLWSENGMLEAWKTEGGHRRISKTSVARLLGGLDGGGLPQEPARPSRSGGGLKVLVVEDDLALLNFYRAAFAQWFGDVELVTAENGVEGLIRVGRESPDLMITDLSMPGMDGFELLRNLAVSNLRQGMEIVVVTGMDAESIAESGGLPAGIRLLHKPVPFGEIKTIVAGILSRQPARAT